MAAASVFKAEGWWDVTERSFSKATPQARFHPWKGHRLDQKAGELTLTTEYNWDRIKRITTGRYFDEDAARFEADLGLGGRTPSAVAASGDSTDPAAAGVGSFSAFIFRSFASRAAILSVVLAGRLCVLIRDKVVGREVSVPFRPPGLPLLLIK